MKAGVEVDEGAEEDEAEVDASFTRFLAGSSEEAEDEEDEGERARLAPMPAFLGSSSSDSDEESLSEDESLSEEEDEEDEEDEDEDEAEGEEDEGLVVVTLPVVRVDERRNCAGACRTKGRTRLSMVDAVKQSKGGGRVVNSKGTEISVQARPAEPDFTRWNVGVKREA